jgi:hypothetical protein
MKPLDIISLKQLLGCTAVLGMLVLADANAHAQSANPIPGNITPGPATTIPATTINGPITSTSQCESVGSIEITCNVTGAYTKSDALLACSNQLNLQEYTNLSACTAALECSIMVSPSISTLAPTYSHANSDTWAVSYSGEATCIDAPDENTF